MMKKMITYLAMLSMVPASVPAAGIQAAAAAETTVTIADAEQKAAPSDLSGRWYYQENGRNIGYVMVDEDGRYSYFDYAKNAASGGTVKVDEESFVNGSTLIWYYFYDNNGTFRFGCHKTENGFDSLGIGQDDTARLVKDTENYETASVKDMAGRFFYQKFNEKNGRFENAGSLHISTDGTYTYYADTPEMAAEGTVKLDYEVYPDGSTTPWFSFVDMNGNAWFGCYGAKGSNLFTNGGSQERLVRERDADAEQQANPSDLAGKWLLESYEKGHSDVKTGSMLTVDEDGHFFCLFNLTDGHVDEATESFGGQVRTHVAVHDDGTETTFYQFVKEDETIFAEGTLNADGMSMDLVKDGAATMVRDQSVRKASASEISGSWILKEMMNVCDPKAGYTDAGIVTVNDDNTYSYRAADGKQSGGIVFASYELHPDGNVTVWYDFQCKDGTFFLGCQDSLDRANQNTLCVGHTAEQMLVRKTAVPNAYGYYDPDVMPAAGISVKALEGEWKYDDATLYISCGSEQEGMFEMFHDAEGRFASGQVKIQYRLDQSGQKHFYYVLYSGEDLYLEFDMTGELPLTALRTKDSDPITFVRGSEPFDADGCYFYDMAKAPACRSAAALEGSWKENGAEPACILTFSHLDDVSGRFRLVAYTKDGSVEHVSEGIVKLQYNYDMSGEREYLYVLYLADPKTGAFNQILMTIQADCNRQPDTLRLSNVDISFGRIETQPAHKYSDEQLVQMAKKDYLKKTGILPADSHQMVNAGGSVTVVLTDANGADYDAYTVDPDTGIGERFSDRSTVNLPQTGNYSLKALILAISAFLLTGFGCLAVRCSGLLRSKKAEQ